MQKILIFSLLFILFVRPTVSTAQEENFVIYRDNGNLFSISTSGGAVTRLTSEDSRIGVVRYDVTANGNVIFQSGFQSGSRLYIVPVMGGALQQLHEGPVGRNYVITPEFVVFSVRANLFSVHIDSGDLIQLSSSDQTFTGDDTYNVSADGHTVIFTAKNARGVQQLYSVPINGGDSAPINGRLTSGGNVWKFAISPTSTHVVYIADQAVDENWQVYSVPITGGDVVELSPPMYFNFGLGQLLISPDGTRVSFTGRLPTDNFGGVWYSPMLGGELVKIGEGDSPSYDPTGAHIIFLASDFVYQVSIGTQERTQLTIGSINWTDTYTNSFAFSGDRQWILYTAGICRDGESWMDIAPTSSPLDVRRLDENVVERCGAGYATTWLVSAAISPDSRYVAYVAKDNTGVPQVYSIPLGVNTTGTPDLPRKLNTYSGSNRFGGNQLIRITANSSTVIYTNDEEAEGFVDIYSVPIDGSGEAVRLTPDSAERVQDFILYPEGTSWYQDFHPTDAYTTP